MCCFFTMCPSNYHLEKSADPVYEEPEEFKLQEIPTEPAYEEPAALCKLQSNIAYQVPPSRIKIIQNEAYSAISNT